MYNRLHATEIITRWLKIYPTIFSDHWDSFFDLIIVDACKPRFFEEGTPMKIVDKNSGNLSNDASLIGENNSIIETL